jgi:hypothetical protein
MKVDGPGSLRNSSSARRTGRVDSSSSAAFAKALHGESDSSAPAVGGIQGTGAISPLIGIQEVDDATSGPSRAKARAQQMLDKLGEIQTALLTGYLPQSKLADLAGLVQSQRAEVGDERLSALLDEIDLRAQVELAKLTPGE